MKKTISPTGLVLVLLLAAAPFARADEDDNTNTKKPEASEANPQASDSRIFGVIPNYRSTSLQAGAAPPLDAKGKMHLAFRAAMDPGTFAVSGFFAGIGHLNHQYPTFGQGPEGLGRRYGMMLIDNISTPLLTDGAVPALFRQDPRYYRIGEGSARKRIGYSLSRVWLARCDNGKRCLNYGELVGNGLQSTLSNYYYPAAERNGSNLAARATIALAPDLISNLLREFWPDIERRFKNRKANRKRSTTRGGIP